MSSFIPNLSVDCVVFGFDAEGKQLKILVYERDIFDNKSGNMNLKFPGSMVPMDEDPDDSAHKVLFELTGLKKVCLKQFYAFGNPNRIKFDEEKKWVEKHYGVKIDRVVTIAYYALIRIDKSNPEQKKIVDKLKWITLDNTENLAFDHSLILQKALSVLRRDILLREVNGFELLPKKFTLPQLQSMYEVIIGKKLDKRNFRKKITKASYIKSLDEKQKGVAHKPANLYCFDTEEFEKSKEELNTIFI